MKIKDFFKEHGHLKLSLQHLRLYGGGWMIEVYNTTWNHTTPVFKHYILDEELDNLNEAIDFETAIMTPIASWWDEQMERERIFRKFRK